MPLQDEEGHFMAAGRDEATSQLWLSINPGISEAIDTRVFPKVFSLIGANFTFRKGANFFVFLAPAP